MERLLTRIAAALGAASLASCTAPEDVRIENATGEPIQIRVISDARVRTYEVEANASRLFKLKEYRPQIRVLEYSYSGKTCMLGREDVMDQTFRNKDFDLVLRLTGC